MASLNGFNAADIAPREDFTPLPTGEYTVEIVDSDMKNTKAGTGQYLQVEYAVTDGEFKGRKLWSRHNLVNANSKTEEIAQRELSAICHAVGVLRPNDSAELHYKPLVVRVEFVPAGGRQERDGNEIKSWKAAAGGLGNAQPLASRPQTAAAMPASPSSATPPWQRKAA